MKSFGCGLHGLVQPHVVAEGTLYGLAQTTPKSNSMDVVVCINPSQTSLNLAGHIIKWCLVCFKRFGYGLHGLGHPHVVAGNTLYGFSANYPKK
jgi:hypothetical protein